jgi:type VI secretion system protein ImpF
LLQPETKGLPRFSLIDRLSLEDSPGDSDALFSGSLEGSGDEQYQAAKVVYRSATKRYEDLVKRDLEWLFNTRRTFDERIERYPQLSSSVYAYGLPDITSVNVSSVRDQKKLLEIMRASLEMFDRRLRDIQIDFEPLTVGNRGLHFRISCILLMDPAPEEICIDTVLDANNSKYEVK